MWGKLSVQLTAKIIGALCVCFLAGGAALAQAQSEDVTITGSVAFTTDYRFRGISQTDEHAAVSGGLDLALDNGTYLGIWGSNVDFGGSLEMNAFVGYGNDINESSSFDVGILYYYYPADNAKPDLDYWEVYGSISWLDLTLGVAYSNDYYQGTGKFWYPYVQYSRPLMDRLSFNIHAGYNLFDTAGFFEDDTEEYTDWSVGLELESLGAAWSLSLVGTDITNDQTCYGNASLCDTALIFAISKGF